MTVAVAPASPSRAEPDRCSSRSEAAGESLAGTASTVRNWLLLEHPGPWGERALHDARMPEGLGARLRALEREHRFRTILIRRPVRDPDPRTTCFAVHTGPATPWIERADLRVLGEACELDLAALGRGERPGLQPHDEALFAVCTHGRHDRCCAERGRPTALALGAAFPAQTWECSHIGGDRFAANLVAFPHGLYFGRVSPERAPEVARAYLEGRIDLSLLRGRSSTPMDVQAADRFLRVDLGLVGVDDVEVAHVERHGDDVRVVLDARGTRSIVHVRSENGPPMRLTCRAPDESVPPAWRLVSIDAAD